MIRERSSQQREDVLDGEALQHDWNSKFLALVRDGFVPSGRDSGTERGPFGRSVDQYRQKGWLGTLPLPKREKHPPPTGFTGRGAAYPDDEQIRRWQDESKYPGASIGLHLGLTPDGKYEIVGIDADDYTKGDKRKRGGRELKDLETRLGPLPATYISTSRELPSGIRFFRVPVGYAFRGKLAESIEVIQRVHRYAVVWPSWNPDSRAYYVWLDKTGIEMSGPPDVDDLPILSPTDPETAAWFGELTREGMRDGGDTDIDMDSTVDEIRAWAESTLPGYTKRPCLRMQAAVKYWQDQIEEDASTHDKITGAHWELACLAVEGHRGLGTAKAKIENRIARDTIKVRGKRGIAELRNETFRSYINALRKLKAETSPQRGEPPQRVLEPPCDCGLAEKALAPGGAWDSPQFHVVGDELSRATSDGQPSWAAIDLRAAMRDAVTVVPRVLIRSDGAALLYPGKVHSVHGESESGKSWLALCAAAERLSAGEPVLFLDFEDSGASVANRLLLLGVPMDVLCNPDMFRYINPEINPGKGSDAEKRAFVQAANGTYSLAVIDGVTEAMTLYGLSGKDADDVAAWHQQLPKVLARHTGAAVVCIDHVTKDPTTRSRWAQGSQHKMSALDGAAYVVEAESPLAVGQAGRLSVRVAKDRPGRVRGLAGKWRKSDRTQHVADLHLDSSDPARSLWRLDVPEDAGQPTEVDDSTGGAKGKPRKILTWFMEQLSLRLELLGQQEQEAADSVTAAKARALRTRNKIAGAMEVESEKRGKGKQRDYWREALGVLVHEGFLQTATGPRGSNIHNVVKPYRQADDPLSDRYSGVSDETVRNFRVRLGEVQNDDEMASES